MFISEARYASLTPRYIIRASENLFRLSQTIIRASR
jgi:hypothetical protein